MRKPSGELSEIQQRNWDITEGVCCDQCGAHAGETCHYWSRGGNKVWLDFPHKSRKLKFEKKKSTESSNV